MTKLSVLLTGAGGYITHQLLPVFRERYDLKLVDVKRERDGEVVEGVEIADLLHDDPGTLASLFSGVDVVVHTGYYRPSGTDPQALYDGERRNVDMAQRVYQLALEQGVRRVVAASTNQATRTSVVALRTPQHTQRFLSVFGLLNTHFRPPRHLLKARD